MRESPPTTHRSPDDSYKEGARIFPSLVPTSADDPAAVPTRRAWEVFKQWDKPFICCFSDSDPVTAGGDKPFPQAGARRPGPAARPRRPNAHHFFQEDGAPQIAQILIDAIGAG